MKRREFMAFLAAIFAAPLILCAQQPDQARRIGMITSFAENDPEATAQENAFRDGLRQLGWTQNHNVRIEYRRTGGNPERARAYAEELVQVTELILAVGTVQLSIVSQQTRTVPIVFAQVGDPVVLGFVASMGRPGGNITGFSEFDFDIGGKWLQILKEISPSTSSVAVIYNPDEAQTAGYMRSVEAAASQLGMQLILTAVHNAEEIERGMDAIPPVPNTGLIVIPSPVNSRFREKIVGLAAAHKLPGVYPFRYFARGGGLVSYGVVTNDLVARAATYVDRILKGANPADLPVQGPTKFELVINLKTARALGMTVPPMLLARADEVIE